jgi:hypothetical protein
LNKESSPSVRYNQFLVVNNTLVEALELSQFSCQILSQEKVSK